MSPGDKSGRVVHSHTIARRALAAAGVFAAVALVWAIVVLIRGGSWWGPLHSFLVGTVLLSISGLSQMFTITWAAAPAPPGLLAAAQRWLVAAGAASVLVGMSTNIDGLVWLGAAALVAGLATLGASIVGAVRNSLLRRFDLSARFYLTAFPAGMVGVVLGAILGSRWVLEPGIRIRLVHYHLTLVGLVGLTIIGTLPTFLPTVAHRPAVSGREALVAWWLSLAGMTAFVFGLFTSQQIVGAGSALTGAAALLVLGGIVIRLWNRGRAKLAFLQISAGTVWLVAWAAVDALVLLTGEAPGSFSGWTAAVVVAGVGQVLLGSLAYLVPVLAGTPFDGRFDLFQARRWLPLVSANAAPIALIAGFARFAVAGFALWLADFAWRLWRLRQIAIDLKGRARP